MPDEAVHTAASIVSAMDANTQRARSLAGGLTRQQFNWQPAPGVWSIGQNLGHLNILDGEASLKAIREAIAEGRAAGWSADGPFRCGFLSAKFVATQAPPVTRRYKAPKAFEAPLDLDPEKTLGEYLRISGEARRLVESAAGLDLGRIKTILPALPALVRPLLKMSLAGRLVLLATHDARHIWQIERIRERADFPEKR